MFRASNFEKLLDKATSSLRLDPDWPTILQICDLIRQNDCTPKNAVAAIKKKLYSQNPHQAMFALLTLESVVKNCGSGIHDEVASKAFCETLMDLVKTTQHENLKSKILELIQAWAFAFRKSPKYRAVQDIVNILKTEGYKFPVFKESDAMFSADTAPDWADGEVCHRCRVIFSLMVRRHHCRACGQVFCQQCSSKTSTLPKFGIEKEVRVCDACFDKVSRPPSSSAKLEIADTTKDYGPSQPQKRPAGGKTAEELQEEEELQLALALSQSEAEHKEKEKRSKSLTAPEPASHHPTISPTPSSVSASPDHSAANSELSRYLDRSYWEQRSATTRDSAPAPTAPMSQSARDNVEAHSKQPAGKSLEDDAEDKEIDEFLDYLRSQIEIFVNRMKSNSSRGRSIANDTSVQTLFMNITAMHSRLLRYIQQQDDKRVYLESLQDKITQVRDSRAALDTLRAEHQARLAAAAEAAERQRQMQMAAKLQAMRKKKHEYLQYQRQLALQRVQEQEREMQMRQEQQKHQYMMSSNGGYFVPGVPMQQYQQNYPNQPMYANPQFHQMLPQSTTDANINIPGQPQMSQANMAMNQLGQMPPNIPMTNAFAVSTSGMTISQAPNAQASNVRPNMTQQLPIQQQIMLQQMQQQMRMQPGVHQMVPQIPNGQNVPQQNGQLNQQMPKSNNQMPNQTMMTPMSMAPQNITQSQLNAANPMLGMHMQNMRMAGLPNQQMPGYPMNIANQQNGPQNTNVPSQIQGQLPLPGQQMMQSLPGLNQNAPSHLPPTSQSVPQAPQTIPHDTQISHGQQLSMQGQNMPGYMHAPGQQMQPPGAPTNIQGQPINSQGQNIPQQPNPNQPQLQGQNMPGQHMQHTMQGGQISTQSPQQMVQQLPQGAQAPQNMPGNMQHLPQNIQQGQQMPPNMQQVQQLPPNMQQGQNMQNNMQGPQMVPNMQQGQQMPQNMQMQGAKMHQPNANAPQPNQQTQQAQTPIKSEQNNNTAELINFD